MAFMPSSKTKLPLGISLIIWTILSCCFLYPCSAEQTKRPYIEFCGAAQMVGGTCMLIDTGKSRILIDFGLFYGKQYEAMNRELRFQADTIDHLILTHGHLDHSGRIPYLYKRGFKGNVYGTDATRDITDVMLSMSMSLMKEQGEPLYDMDDLMKTMEGFQSLPYNKPYKIKEDITLVFRNAGHILGSAIAELTIKTINGDVKIIATGDMGYDNMPIINEPSIITEGDYVIVESTYGDKKRTHKGYEDFGRDIQQTIQQGGSVLIPAFALDKTQKVIYLIGELKRRGVLKKDIPVIVDSSTAKALTKIYRKYTQYYNKEALTVLSKYGDPFGYEDLFEISGDVALKYHDSNKPAIYVSTSGMLDYSNAPKHLLKMIDNPINLLALVGWQSPESLGRKLQDGNKEVHIKTTEYKDGKKQIMSHKRTVKIRVKRYEQFSSHADGCYIINWLSNFQSSRGVFVIHGEKENALALSAEIRKKLGFKTWAPKLDQRIYLDETKGAKAIQSVNKALLCEGLGNKVSIESSSDQ